MFYPWNPLQCKCCSLTSITKLCGHVWGKDWNIWVLLKYHQFDIIKGLTKSVSLFLISIIVVVTTWWKICLHLSLGTDLWCVSILWRSEPSRHFLRKCILFAVLLLSCLSAISADGWLTEYLIICTPADLGYIDFNPTFCTFFCCGTYTWILKRDSKYVLGERKSISCFYFTHLCFFLSRVPLWAP